MLASPGATAPQRDAVASPEADAHRPQTPVPTSVAGPVAVELAGRIHWMDHLRALAMLAGVVFHAALAYSPLMHGFFPTADRSTSASVDAVIWGLHLVRMPLFFVVAGFFAAWVLARRGGAGLLRQRMRRVLVPFLVAWPLTWAAMSASTLWAATNVRHPSPFLAMLRDWLRQPDVQAPPPGTGHLWFLYYLLVFAVLHWIVRTLDLGRIGRWLVAQPPSRALLALPLLLVPALASVSAPHPAPEGLVPQFWAIAFYGMFFASGTLLHARPDWLDRAHASWPWLVAACAAGYVAFLWRLGDAPPSVAQPTAGWGVASLEACLAVWLTVLCLLAGRRLLDTPSTAMRWLAQGAYWTYLLHLPVLFAVQYALMDLAWPWPAKLAVSVAATLAVCLGSYEAVVRRTRLRRFVG
jgi:glucan biosynthesis protein C